MFSAMNSTQAEPYHLLGVQQTIMAQPSCTSPHIVS